MTTITTAAALVALPHLSAVLVDKEGRACQRDTTFSPPRWWVTGTTVTLDDEDMLGFLPLTVLYRPDQPEPVKPSREGVAHDAEVAAKALEDAAAHVHGFAEDRFDDARGEGFSASFTSPDYQRGRAYEQACLWLRARAATIRAEAQREGVGCKHCGRPIAGEGGHIHTAGANRGLHRCDPNDSGLPYGLCAEAVGDACGPICTGGQ